MAKAKEVELNTEEQAELAALLAKEDAESNNLQRLPALLINTSPTDEDDNEIPLQTFTILGEKGLYSKTIKFQPIKFVNKLMDMRQDATTKRWKCANESIFFIRAQEPIDAAGGVGCGRLLGRATSNMNEEQKKINKGKAQFYGFLFGLVTFPDQEPRLVSFRMGASKAVTIGNVLQDVEKQGLKPREVYLDLKLVTNKKDRKSIHPDIDVSFSPLEKAPTNNAVFLKAVKEVTTFVDGSNKQVYDSHVSAIKRKTSNITSAKLVQQLVDNSEEDEELNDSIPF